MNVSSKITPSLFTIKEGSTSFPKPLSPQETGDVTAPTRRSLPLRSKVGGPSEVSPEFFVRCKPPCFNPCCFLILLCLLLFTPTAKAQNDPTLAGMVLLYTEKAEKELKNQEKVMLLETTGHIWTKEEVEATTDLQREFNGYLDNFRSIVCYAAQIYGFYHEISQLTDNMGEFTRQASRQTTNAVAVALSSKRNKIYRELIMNSIEIVNDIRTVCLSDNKMTEKERMEIVFGIRPKLKTMNTKLKRLCKAIKYTTMSDVWYEIDEGARPKPVGKKEIAEAAKRRWRQNGRDVRP